MTILNQEQLLRNAPSIFAERPWIKMSDRYRFVPTSRVVDELRSDNFYPVQASQSTSRTEGKANFTKHIIRFRRIEDLNNAVGEEIPELVLVNSHDGTCTYKLMFGIFRIVCGNGLVVASGMINDVDVKHLGYNTPRKFLNAIMDASHSIIGQAPKVLNRIEEWKKIELQPAEQTAFAESALQLRDSNLVISPEQALDYRRYADDKPTLWHTYNRVQENFFKGGKIGRNAEGKRIATRSIKSVDTNVKLNQALWTLTEKMAELKTK